MANPTPAPNPTLFVATMPSNPSDRPAWLKVTVEIDWDYLRWLSDSGQARLPWVRERAVSLTEKGVRSLFLLDAERDDDA